MKKWEYQHWTLGASHHGTDDTLKSLNEMGERGWEIIEVCTIASSSTMYIFFKREKSESAVTAKDNVA